MIITTTPVSRDLGDDALPTTSTSAVTTSTTSTSVAPPGPEATVPPAVGALITPSGVVVAMLEDTGSGYRVRTPCGVETSIQGGEPIEGVDVVIDPGHGGATDPGAVGPNGLSESELNLRLAREVQSLLEGEGVAAILTRTSDYGSTLGVRSALADHVGARLMVSIHHNAPTPGRSDRPGTEVFVQSNSEESRRLGGLLYESIVRGLSTFDIAWTAAPDAGVLEVLNTRGTDAYGMLRNPETVTALAELGYLSSRPEAELFDTAEYARVAAEAVVSAIVDYLEDDSNVGRSPEGLRVFNPQPGVSGGACEEPDLG